MVEEENSDKPDFKLYTIAQIGIACFFATPFTALIMIAANFKAAGRIRGYKQALVTAIVLFPFIIFFLSELADRRTYRILIFFVAAATAYIAKLWQGSMFQEHVRNGGQRKSVWSVIGILLFGVASIFCGLIILGLFTGV